MQRSLLFFLATCVLQAAASESTHHAKVAFKVSRRSLLTCEETYGNGSIPCGTSTYCYNPSIGQTCCSLDNGYCDEGTHCAPVAGYCCLDSETDDTCATNAGFDLPVASISGALSVRPFLTGTGTLVPEASAEAGTGAGTVTESTTETVVASVEITLFPAAQTEATQITLFPAPVSQTTLTIPTATGPWPSSNISANVSATHIPTVVQVSVARTEQRTLMWTSIGIAAVALFMSTC